MSTSFSALPRRTRQQHGSNRQRRRYSSRDTVAVVNLSATTQKVHGTFICIRQQHINLHTSAAARGGTREEDTEVHLEVTRLERHAIFRRSISLDDVDCFDTLKSQAYQWHEFITLLFQGLRGPFRVVLMRTSCQSRFLLDVIE